MTFTTFCFENLILKLSDARLQNKMTKRSDTFKQDEHDGHNITQEPLLQDHISFNYFGRSIPAYR